MHSKKISDIKEIYQLSNNENLPSRKSEGNPAYQYLEHCPIQ
jgi:hypothetical protein